MWPHNLRRTLANIAATVLGSQNLADEHILHFNKYTSGAKANYFDPSSLEFLETRRETFEKCHQRIDDLILSGLPSSTVIDETEDREPFWSGLAINYGQRDPYPILNQSSNTASPDEIKMQQPLQVVSPMGMFASDEPVYIDLSNRPLTASNLFEDWVSLDGSTGLKDFKSRIV